MTLKEIQNLVKEMSEKFLEEDVFDVVMRLWKECGEIVSEIQKIEKKRFKGIVYFGISDDDKEKISKNLVDVLLAIAAIANFYDLDLEKEIAKAMSVSRKSWMKLYH